MENVEEEVRVMRVGRWRTKIKDKVRWRGIVIEAKAHIGLWSKRRRRRINQRKTPIQRNMGEMISDPLAQESKIDQVPHSGSSVRAVPGLFNFTHVSDKSFHF